MTYREFLGRVFTIAAVIIAFLGIWELRNILLLTFLSSIIAIALSIPVGKLQEWGVRRGYAILITVVSGIVLIALFMIWLLPVIVDQMADLVAELPAAAQETADQYNTWHAQQGSTARELLPRADFDELNGGEANAGDSSFSIESVSGFALPAVTVAGNFILSLVANLFIILIVTIFMLLTPMDYAKGFITLLPTGYRRRGLEVLIEVRRTIANWVTALSFSIMITVFLVWLILGIVLGVPNALALGVIAGLATIIPNVGSIIPAIPITIFTLADEPRKLPIVIAAYFLIQQTEGNVITPIIVRSRLDIPAGLLLVFQLISATLFGFFGLLLAVPLLAVSMTLIREIYVYDILGMRGVSVGLEQIDKDKVELTMEEEPEDYEPVRVQIDDATDDQVEDYPADRTRR